MKIFRGAMKDIFKVINLIFNKDMCMLFSNTYRKETILKVIAPRKNRGAILMALSQFTFFRTT